MSLLIESVGLALKTIQATREAITTRLRDLVPSETLTTLLIIEGMDILQAAIYQTAVETNSRLPQLELATATAV